MSISVSECRGSLSVLAAAAAAPPCKWTCSGLELAAPATPKTTAIACWRNLVAAAGRLLRPLLGLGPSLSCRLLDPSLFLCFCTFLVKRRNLGRTARFPLLRALSLPLSRASSSLRSFGTAGSAVKCFADGPAASRLPVFASR